MLAVVFIMMSEKEIKLQKAWMLVCLIEKYYETDGAGGCVHIITDDGNYGKGYAQSCLDYAIEQKDYWGEHIARLFLEFNEDEQEQIVERSWEIYEQMFS
jgi:hypothetical protein